MPSLFNLRKNLFLLVLTYVLVSFSAYAGGDEPPANGEVSTIGYHLEENGFQVDVTIGEFSNSEQLKTSVENITRDLKAEHEENPEAFLEVGELGATDPLLREFNESLVGELNAKQIPIDRTGSLTLNPAAFESVEFQPNPKTKRFWTRVRVGTILGLRVGSLLYSGLSPFEAVVVSASTTAFCILTGKYYKEINTIADKWRWYKAIDKTLDALRVKFPSVKNRATDPSFAKKVDKIHGNFNWGGIDVLFNGAVTFSENVVRYAFGLPLNVPSFLRFWTDVLLALTSQRILDRAARKDFELAQALAKQDPSINLEIAAWDYYKKGAFASIMAVVGYTNSGSENKIVAAVGYATFGALAFIGKKYEKRVDRKVAEGLIKIDSCNEILANQ